MVEHGLAGAAAAVPPLAVGDKAVLQSLLHLAGQVYLLFQNLVLLIQLAGDALVLLLGFNEFGNITGNTHNALHRAVCGVPGEFGNLAPGGFAAFPFLMVNAVQDGLARGHDVGFFGTGNFAHFGVKEITVAAADEVGRCTHLHLFGGSLIGNHESGLAVLEVDVVRQVVNQRAEEVAVLHGVQISHLAAGDIHPHAHQAARFLVLIEFQQAIDAYPAPGAAALVEQAHFHAQRRCAGTRTVDIALYRVGEEGHILGVNGLFRLGEDVGCPVFHAHAHHFHALLGVENLIILKQPAVYAFLGSAQRFAHHIPYKYSGYGALLVALLGIIAHLPDNIPIFRGNFKQKRRKIGRKISASNATRPNQAVRRGRKECNSGRFASGGASL